jgi:hypothetical protein
LKKTLIGIEICARQRLDAIELSCRIACLEAIACNGRSLWRGVDSLKASL